MAKKFNSLNTLFGFSDDPTAANNSFNIFNYLHEQYWDSGNELNVGASVLHHHFLLFVVFQSPQVPHRQCGANPR
jgi:hypothetical protein